MGILGKVLHSGGLEVKSSPGWVRCCIGLGVSPSAFSPYQDSCWRVGVAPADSSGLARGSCGLGLDRFGLAKRGQQCSVRLAPALRLRSGQGGTHLGCDESAPASGGGRGDCRSGLERWNDRVSPATTRHRTDETAAKDSARADISILGNNILDYRGRCLRKGDATCLLRTVASSTLLALSSSRGTRVTVNGDVLSPFDASGHPGQRGALTVAGYVSRVNKWKGLRLTVNTPSEQVR